MASKTKAQQQLRQRPISNRWVLLTGVLVVLGCIAYSNSLDVPFAFDDIDSVQINYNVRFPNYSLYRPQTYIYTRSLLYASFAFNYWLAGENVLGYHIVNLLLHLLNGLLVFAVAIRILKKVLTDPGLVRTYALLSAAFFLVHPVQTESVTYISSRSELLSTFFYLSGFLLFLSLPESKIGFLAGLGIVLFLLIGLGAKETVVTLPAVVLLYDYLFIAKTRLAGVFSRWRFYLVFVILGAAGAYYLVAKQIVAFGALVAARESIPRWNYLLTQPRVIIRYLRLLVFPTGLNLDYDFRVSVSILEPAVLLSLLVIAGLIVTAWRWRQTRPVFAFSIFWFFITLSPTSSIIPIPDVIFEHRLYLPLAGVCLSFPFVMEWFISLWKGRVRNRGLLVSATAVLAVLTTLTVLRNDIWRDEIRLWSDVISKSPHKLRVYSGVMYAYMKRGQDEKAIPVAKLGAENVPEARVSFLDTLGNLYLKLGRPDQAVEYFKTSTAETVRMGMTPFYQAGYFNNLGVAYMAFAKTLQGSNRIEAWRSAQDAFRKSLEGHPSNVRTLDGLINATHNLGEGKLLEQESRKRPAEVNDFRSLYSLAALLSLEERYGESLGYFDRAEKAFSDGDAGGETLFFNYAFALSKAGQVDNAIAKYLEALKIDPFFGEAHYNLALLYVGKQDHDSALQHLTSIVGRDPNNVRANMMLAEIYAYQGKLPSARQHLQLVLQVEPQNVQALSLRQRIGLP